MNNHTTANIDTHLSHRASAGRFRGFLLLFASVATFALVACSPPTLVATITADTTSGPAPLQITFTDTADLSVDSREWTFSDGSESATTIDDEPATVTRTFTQAGEFTATVRSVRGDEAVESSMTFTVLPGPVASITVDGVPEAIAAGDSASVSVTAEDEFGNVIESPTVRYESDVEAGQIEAGGTFNAATTVASSDDAITVTVEHGGGSVTETFGTDVIPAKLVRLEVTPESVEALPNEAVQITATAYDEFDNPITDADIDYSATSAAGSVTSSGRLTTSQTAGSQSNGVTVTATVGSDSEEVVLPVEISHGPLASVVLSPSELTADVDSEHEFSAMAMDEFGNEISDAEIVFSTDAGSVDEEGNFSASVTAGTYEAGIAATASTSDGIEVIASLDVTLLPLELSRVEIDPAAVQAGGTQALTATATDRFGNALDAATLTWTTVDEAVGEVSQLGVLTAGTVARTYVGAVSVSATLDGNTADGTANIVISPAALSQVDFLPKTVTLGMEMDQQLVAVAGDQYGNLIIAASITWETNPEAGSIADSTFTSSSTPGSYSDGITLTASFDGTSVSEDISVTVEPDRIAYLSGTDITDDFRWQLMDTDGNHIEELLFGVFNRGPVSFTPDGRRMLFSEWAVSSGVFLTDEDLTSPDLILVNPSDASGGFQQAAVSPDGKTVAAIHIVFASNTQDLVLVDLDGGNMRTIVSTFGSSEVTPSWSPDGKYVIYGEVNESTNLIAIYKVDVETGQKTRLTNHVEDSFQPVYSPDGTKIAFSSLRNGTQQIFVMDEDGSNVVQLTTDGLFSGAPFWSPDGEKILFVSERNGNNLDIFIMNADGTDETRLTTSSDVDTFPVWAPRKSGVAVTTDGLFLEVTPGPEELSTQELTQKLRPMVVKIETDLGSGSGFFVRQGGYILTNNHVIVDATQITVTVDGGESYPATLLGRDMAHDMAVLKIELEDHAVVEFAKVSDDNLGQDVVAFGFPLGSETLNVTRGVISSLLVDEGRGSNWVQTDAAVNPGNSGGPLITTTGKVIGVVTSRFTGDVENVAFAIDAVTLNIFLDAMINGETIVSAAG